jgi:hypothetical protein
MIEEEELPPSTFTPIPVETLDWETVHAQMGGIELKLARIKLAWWEMMIADYRLRIADCG